MVIYANDFTYNYIYTYRYTCMLLYLHLKQSQLKNIHIQFYELHFSH